MLKDRDANAGADDGRQCRSSDEVVSPDGRVYCFVGTTELRRLLSLLAGIELLGDLVRSVTRGSFSPGEAQLPPGLL